jgi:hypothetical protein
VRKAVAALADVRRKCDLIALVVVVMRAGSVDLTTSHLSVRHHLAWKIGETDVVVCGTIGDREMSEMGMRRHWCGR